jgi:copper chaperone
MSREKVLLVVEGMSCGHCEQTVEKGLRTLPGVHQVKADHSRKIVSVEIDPGTRIDPLKDRIRELGYEPLG